MSLCSHLAARAWNSAWRIWTRSSCPYTWSRPRAPWCGHLGHFWNWLLSVFSPWTSWSSLCRCGRGGWRLRGCKGLCRKYYLHCIKAWNCSYLQERSMDCKWASVSTSVELPSRETIWLSAGTFIASYSSLLLKLLVTTRLTIILLASPLVLRRWWRRTLGRLRRALVRAAAARAVTEPRHAQVPGHQHRAPRTRSLDISNQLCMKGFIASASQLSKSGQIVETLGSTQVMQEKFPVAGLWLVKLLILANHRPATGNFSCITWVDPSVSTISPLLASCEDKISSNTPTLE